MTTTAAARVRSAAVVVPGLLLLTAGPVLAHGEGLTPYFYVSAPPGVTSTGTPGAGVSTQPLDRFGFAGTTDNQMQLTLPEDVLPARQGEQGDACSSTSSTRRSYPPCLLGLKAEGNGYRVSLAYAPSGARLDRLAGPARVRQLCC